jgi:hypothetical protein
LFIKKPKIDKLFYKKNSSLKNILFSYCNISDLSATGCSIQTDKYIEKDSILYIETNLNNSNYNWKAQIVWNSNLSDENFNYGFKFIDTKKEEQERLNLIYSLQLKKRS